MRRMHRHAQTDGHTRARASAYKPPKAGAQPFTHSPTHPLTRSHTHGHTRAHSIHIHIQSPIYNFLYMYVRSLLLLRSLLSERALRVETLVDVNRRADGLLERLRGVVKSLLDVGRERHRGLHVAFKLLHRRRPWDDAHDGGVGQAPRHCKNGHLCAFGPWR